jgi:putative NADPH-quinone reductase
MTRILIVNGHPDPRPATFCAALAAAYAAGAAAGGHEVRRIDIGTLDLPIIHNAAEFGAPASHPAALAAQQDITWCQHLVIVHPLWLGSQPAMLKLFFEQVFRYGFAIPRESKGFPKGLLEGRTARTVVTMGMPGFIYRWMFGAFAVRAIERSLLKLSGIRPLGRTLIGGAAGFTPAQTAAHFKTMDTLGRRAR